MAKDQLSKEEFKEELDEFLELYAYDYFESSNWSFTEFSSDDDLEAMVTLQGHRADDKYEMQIIQRDGALQIYFGDDHYSELDSEGFFIFLWNEENSMRRTLEVKIERMQVIIDRLTKKEGS